MVVIDRSCSWDRGGGRGGDGIGWTIGHSHDGGRCRCLNCPSCVLWPLYNVGGGRHGRTSWWWLTCCMLPVLVIFNFFFFSLGICDIT